MGKEISSLRYMGNEELNTRFKYYQYKEFMIYKNGTWWFVLDNKIKQTILMTKTLKKMRQELDKWNQWKERNGEQ